MPGEIRAEITPGSLRKLIQMSRTWDKVSRAEMRKGLREAASKGATDAKSEVLGPPPPSKRGSSGRGSTGLRAGLARGVKVSIKSGRESGAGVVSGEGVRVSATPGSLPGGKEPMLKAYMAGQFRHPVFGSGTWVSQRGKNWFYKPLRSGRTEYQSAVVAAIEKAAEGIARMPG